jgi:hypothetical protein
MKELAEQPASVIPQSQRVTSNVSQGTGVKDIFSDKGVHNVEARL